MARHYEDNETRRRQVAEAALRTIVEGGATHFTTRTVAKRVGIADGTLFRHFGNKKEIVLKAMGLLEVEIEAGFFDTGDARGDLEAFFRQRAAFVGSPDSCGRLIFSNELIHLAGDEGRARIEAWRERSVSYLIDRLTRLRAEGQLRQDLAPPPSALIVQGLLLTFALRASLLRGGESPDVESPGASPRSPARASIGALSDAPLDPRIQEAWRTLSVVLFTVPSP